MRFQEAFIPAGGYWCSPFVRWQGNFASLHPIRFAAEVARRALSERGIEVSAFSSVHLGMTIPARSALYGAPWAAALIGREDLTGPTISQACATSARLIASAAGEVEAGDGSRPAVLCLAADRTSNGPHLVYPNPLSPGARPDSEDWVWDGFQFDPWAENSMIGTAENVAEQEEITTEEQHEVTLLRFQQYQAALAEEAAFHRRYMVAPLDVNPTGSRLLATVKEDEGIFPTTREGLARLKPILQGGTITYGGQTFPADGNAGLVVTTRERAGELARDPGVTIQILAFAEGRARRGFMPMANVPASVRALEQAEVSISDVKAIKTHNPFAVNDIYFAREMGVDLEAMNHFGSSLIWGHPQGPTGLRSMIELMEELILLGGGVGLFTGCAAGDTAAAVVLRVDA
ncbi:MAG: thiolase family protein [Anaerolineales bacterium]